MIEHLYIHIGSDKAGSTAIQGALVANRDWYLDHGITIPIAGLRRSGYPEDFGDTPDGTIV